MRVAIHQPNFMPWLPFFEKMAAVDRFVILSRCQFEKGKYQNRFRFNEAWYTMSVNHGMDPIIEKVYTRPQEDWQKIKTRLPQFEKVFGQFDECIGHRLWLTNFRIILKMAKMLGITTEIILDPITSLKGTDRLVEICRALEADTYLAGQSGAHYMEPEKFAAAGIKVENQDLSKADKRHSLEKLHELI